MHKLYLALCIITLYVLPHHCCAVGYFIPKTDSQTANSQTSITIPVQNAYIAHKNGREELVLQVKYHTGASEFLWLVPTPSKPAVHRFDNLIFRMLNTWAEPSLKYWVDNFRNLYKYSDIAHEVATPGHSKTLRFDVDVANKEQIGIYDIAVLKVKTAEDLQKWSSNNGYSIPEKAVPVISDYLKQGWVFTAIKVNTRTMSGVSGPHEGFLQPLIFNFKSPEPICPLRISSLNQGRSDINMFVGADNYVVSDLLNTTYAGYYFTRIHAAYSPYAVIMGGYYQLTKLQGRLGSEDMTRDLDFRNSYYRVYHTVSPPFLENFGLLVLYIIAVLLSFPASMIIPGVLSLMCTNHNTAVQRMRLFAVSTFSICIAFIYNAIEHPGTTVFGDPVTNFELFILQWIPIIVIAVLIAVCLWYEKNKQHFVMLLFGTLYAGCTIAITFINTSSFQVKCIEYVRDIKDRSLIGLSTIVVLLAYSIMLAFKTMHRRKVTGADEQGADNV